MLKRLCFIVPLALAQAGCDLDERPMSPAFRIDNPTSAPVVLEIDGREYQVPPHGDTPVRLAPGAHLLQGERLGRVRVIVQARSRGGLINPTLSDYVLATEVYTVSEDKRRNFGTGNVRIELDGVQFQGPYRKTHDLFIDREWRFGVHEPFPASRTVLHVDPSGGQIETKIFAVPDFIRYVEDGSGQPGAYLRRNPAGYVQPRHALELTPPVLPPLHPAHEAHAGRLRALHARYLQAVRAEEQLALRKEFFQAQTAFTGAVVGVRERLPTAAHEAYNHFVSTLSRTLSRSALIIAAAGERRDSGQASTQPTTGDIPQQEEPPR